MRDKTFKISILLILCLGVLGVKAQTVTDIDGNVYKTVTIGTQTWMAENLKTTRYNNGTAIPLVTDNILWSNLTTPGYCWYRHDSAAYAQTYGALYNWFTVNTGNLCPTGWHVPSDAEWTTLSNYLGGEGVAGSKLKEPGTTHWITLNTDATNETGFTGLPGGFHNYNGAFNEEKYTGYWWSTTDAGGNNIAYGRKMFYNNRSLKKDYFTKTVGCSVRCIKN